MCGIAGIISLNKNNVQQHYLKAMADVLQHRGQNGEGFFINESNTVGFAHRRLSIIDLSTNAAQPLHYLHYTIIFNGEIYNYIELKEFLSQKNYCFTTKSDTEVIVAAYDYWGNDCTQHFDGMFAFAIYDNNKQQVFITRDEFGEKPLYYYVSKDNTSFFFASEMKALWSIGIEKKMNNTQLLNYLTLGYTSNSTNTAETFYDNIFQLKPRHYLMYDVQCAKYDITKSQYQIPNSEFPNPNVETFKQLFSTSIAARLRSDVAIGTSLSGGIDSSSVVAFIHQQLKKDNYTPTTFTASFPNFEKDETQYSKAVAQHFNLTQHFTTPTEIDFVNEFETLMFHQEEPLQSASVFTQFMVYKLAKEKNITVLLDGQGADEILGGYTKYGHWFLQELLRTNFILFKKEKALLQTNEFLKTWSYKNYFAAFLPIITAKQLQQKAIHQQQINTYIHKDFLHQHQNKKSLQKPIVNRLQDILNYNTHTFGLHELLRYADRNSMAHGREVRLPFLNKELVQFIQSLPAEYKIQNGYTKWILRESVQDLLPNEIVWRKGKTGYEPPQAQWMQSKQIQEMILAARKTLVDDNILNNSIFQKQIEYKAAHDGNNFDWWCLCAAYLFK